MSPGFEPPHKHKHKHNDIDNDFTLINNKITEILATNPDIFILKIGSNDLPTGARCEGRCEHYIYNNENKLITNKSTLKELMRIEGIIHTKIEDKNTIELLQIDPNDQTYKPFDNDIDEKSSIESICARIKTGKKSFNKTYLHGYFPLARNELLDGELSDTPANNIIR